jgi:hypothetical protein
MKGDLHELRWEGMGCIHKAKDSALWGAVVNKPVDVRFP